MEIEKYILIHLEKLLTPSTLHGLDFFHEQFMIKKS
jgi:hypothetical protein